MIQIERLQKPTGKHLIGFHHTSLIDESRTVEGKGFREIPIMVWYPASSVEGYEQKHYQPRKAFEVNYDLHYGMVKSLPWPLSAILGRIFRQIVFADILTNAFIEAPLIDAKTKLPLLIFSQGYTSFMTQNTFLVEELASHGYVVVSVGVPDETVAEYPDGRITAVDSKILAELMKKDVLFTNRLLRNLKKRKQLTPAEFSNFTRLFYAPDKKEVKHSMTEYNDFVHGRMKVWYEDLLFVIENLHKLDRFAHKLDVEKIGVFGMSMGGGLASCAAYYKAPHVVATLSLDGCHYGMPYDGKLEVPFMNIHGYDTSSLLFDKMEKDAYSVKVADTAHLDYTDFTLLEPIYRKIGYTGKKVDPTIMLEIMNKYALAFFDKYVRGMNTDSVLKSKPLFDNIEFEYK